MQEKQFESRFVGPKFAKLRAKIKKVTNAAGSCPEAAAAVRSLAESEHLDAKGLAILKLVARDYDPPGGFGT